MQIANLLQENFQLINVKKKIKKFHKFSKIKDEIDSSDTVSLKRIVVLKRIKNQYKLCSSNFNSIYIENRDTKHVPYTRYLYLFKD